MKKKDKYIAVGIVKVAEPRDIVRWHKFVLRQFPFFPHSSWPEPPEGYLLVVSDYVRPSDTSAIQALRRGWTVASAYVERP